LILASIIFDGDSAFFGVLFFMLSAFGWVGAASATRLDQLPAVS
jgi:hypothetical protein